VRPGTHEIAAVTRSCAIASGGFDVPAGSDATLQLIVEKPSSSPRREEVSRGTATRRLDDAALLELGDRSALEGLEALAGHMFRVSGSQLALRARTGTSRQEVVEPLLVVDGVRMKGFVAETLRGMKASDLARMEVHLGSVAGWEFQSGGAPAVIEIETRKKASEDPLGHPGMCLNTKPR
jgi:hypothetical protein